MSDIRIADMPSYQCHKIVSAAKITNIFIELDGETRVTWLLFGELRGPNGSVCGMQVDQAWLDKFSPSVGGYYVKYDDGYTSFSPQHAFEDGYTPILPATPA